MPLYFELIIRSKVALALTPSEKYKKRTDMYFKQICPFDASFL